jgi:dsRNA-specific ribonuclease
MVSSLFLSFTMQESHDLKSVSSATSSPLIPDSSHHGCYEQKEVTFTDVLKVYGQKYNWGKPLYEVIKSEKGSNNISGEFCTVVCHFNGLATAGRGTLLKDAKNEAAAMMISSLDDSLEVVI